ncbi:MAG: hypothetical protein IRZ33_02035 [Alicyclobacillaceae bacterium]|nr:hypothetical protein [Alicyclobacillaceae bacterium]
MLGGCNQVVNPGPNDAGGAAGFATPRYGNAAGLARSGRVENAAGSAQNEVGGSRGKAWASASGASPLNPPQTESINMPRRFPETARIRLRAEGSDIGVYAASPWRGREITVYAIPYHNVVYDGSRYYLRSTANLVRIGQVRAGQGGRWQLIWHRPGPGDVFVLARSDEGEFALAHWQR